MAQSQLSPNTRSRLEAPAFAITTISRPGPRELANAHCIAAETGYLYVPRARRSLSGIAAAEALRA